MLIPFVCFSRSQVCVSGINLEDLRVSIHQNWTQNLVWLDIDPNDAGRWKRHIVTWHNWSVVFFICHFRLTNIFYIKLLGAEEGFPVNSDILVKGLYLQFRNCIAPTPYTLFDVKDLTLETLVCHLLCTIRIQTLLLCKMWEKDIVDFVKKYMWPSTKVKFSNIAKLVWFLQFFSRL